MAELALEGLIILLVLQEGFGLQTLLFRQMEAILIRFGYLIQGEIKRIILCLPIMFWHILCGFFNQNLPKEVLFGRA